MLILAVLALPLLLTDSLDLPRYFFAVAAVPIVAAMLGPSTMYAVAIFRGHGTASLLWWLPLLVLYGVGIAVSNTIAVLEAVLGKSSAFVRTPKKGGERRSGYRLRGSKVWILEIGMGIYSVGSILAALENGNIGILPFLVIFAAGFLSVGIRTGLSRTGDA
jgi:membrane protein implicated in regulation of membrane protease activity